MDPVLEEMRRCKGPQDIKDSRFRDWVQYLCALVAAKDDEIARLKAQVASLSVIGAVSVGDEVVRLTERGIQRGRPRKESASV
jgi:hypothetical protein